MKTWTDLIAPPDDGRGDRLIASPPAEDGWLARMAPQREHLAPIALPMQPLAVVDEGEPIADPLLAKVARVVNAMCAAEERALEILLARLDEQELRARLDRVHVRDALFGRREIRLRGLGDATTPRATTLVWSLWWDEVAPFRWQMRSRWHVDPERIGCG